MKTSLLLSVFFLGSVLSMAQTFNDCAAEFRSKWKKIQLDGATQKRDHRKTDSLYHVLETAFEGCILGNELPEFNLMSLEGNSFNNEKIAGKVVYLNFWTINCGSCWAEIPALNEINRAYNGNKDFVFISILLDTEDDLSEFLQRHKMRQGIDFELVTNEAPFGSQDLRKAIPFPTHLFIDKQGKIRKKLRGSFSDSQKQQDVLSAAIDELLAQ